MYNFKRKLNKKFKIIFIYINSIKNAKKIIEMLQFWVNRYFHKVLLIDQTLKLKLLKGKHYKITRQKCTFELLYLLYTVHASMLIYVFVLFVYLYRVLCVNTIYWLYSNSYFNKSTLYQALISHVWSPQAA